MSRRQTPARPQLPQLLDSHGVPHVPWIGSGSSAGDRERVRVRHGAHIEISGGLDVHARRRVIHLGLAAAVHRCTRIPHAFGLETAAMIHGLKTSEVPERVTLMVPPGSAGNGRGHVTRKRLLLAEDDVSAVSGLPVTTLPRSVVDCARFLHPRDARVVAGEFLAIRTQADPYDEDRVEREAKVMRTELLAALDSLPTRAPGVRRARAVIEWASPWAESVWETHLRWVLLTWGCRDVVCQKRIVIRGQEHRADLAILVATGPGGETIWLYIEFDGRSKYGTGRDLDDALLLERRRETDIQAQGHRVVRLRAADAGRPESAIARIAEALRPYPGPVLRPVRDLMVAADGTRVRRVP